ncbi:hypothetical protein FRC00_012505, partial [Tulasnella sp. 408]
RVFLAGCVNPIRVFRPIQHQIAVRSFHRAGTTSCYNLFRSSQETGTVERQRQSASGGRRPGLGSRGLCDKRELSREENGFTLVYQS